MLQIIQRNRNVGKFVAPLNLFSLFHETRTRQPAFFKLPWGSFIAKEIMRPDFRPFFIGGVSSFLLLGVGINLTITDADRKESPYHKQFILNERAGGHH